VHVSDGAGPGDPQLLHGIDQLRVETAVDLDVARQPQRGAFSLGQIFHLRLQLPQPGLQMRPAPVHPFHARMLLGVHLTQIFAL